MDFTLPHSLLTQYLKTKAQPTEISRALSLCGPTVDRLTPSGQDWLYHLEIITNRVDSASIYGLAREAAAILPEFGHKAELLPYPKLTEPDPKLPPLKLTIKNNPKLNPRQVGILLSRCSTKPSPDWLKQALIKLGQRPLNNIIDITNYVMFELGHPVHAFDYDRLVDKKIQVREARSGETLTTLDGKTHTLTGGEVVYDNGQGTIIDLPGIMGTQNTVITDKTVNVLLWLEACDPQKIRSASLTHQLRTHAAILNEKHVDPHLGSMAILRAADLAADLTGGRLASRLYDDFPTPPAPKTLDLDLNWLNRFAGVTIPPEKTARILSSLGFVPITSVGPKFTIKIPTFRLHDIAIKEDLAEEVLRVYGYYRLSSQLPPGIPPDTATDTRLHTETDIARYLADLGFTQTYTYSLVSDSLYQNLGMSAKKLLKLQNPLSQEYTHLRQSLIPSLKAVLDQNQGYIKDTLSLFEISHTYHPRSGTPLPQELSTLALLTFNVPYLGFKGFIEALFHQLHLDLKYEPGHDLSAPFKTPFCVDVLHQGLCIGYLAQVKPDIWGAEFNLNDIDIIRPRQLKFDSVSAFTPIIEDLTFTLPPKTYVSPVMDTIRSASKLVTSVNLKSVYRQNYTFTLTYQAPTRQLTDHDIAPLRQEIVTLTENTCHAKLVGSLT